MTRKEFERLQSDPRWDEGRMAIFRRFTPLGTVEEFWGEYLRQDGLIAMSPIPSTMKQRIRAVMGMG